MNKIETAHDVFWLARYAHNTIDPLIQAAQQYDPSIRLTIEMKFHEKYAWMPDGVALGIVCHWERPLMFLTENWIQGKQGVDKVAAKVQEFIDAEQAKLEAEHDAAVEYDILNESMMIAEAKEARDWELRQDRLRERADIERDEHDHDIELQNEYAGN